jgi:hypothetical protein
MFVVRRLTVSLLVALTVTVLYLAARVVLPVVLAMAWSRLSWQGPGVGAVSTFVTEVEPLVVLLVAFAGAWVWQRGSRRKG